MPCRAAVLLILSLPLAAVLAGEDWPAFRGGLAAGVAEGKTLPQEWDTRKNVVWRTDLPGRGWSSPVAAGGRVFVTSVVSDEQGPEPRKGLYISDLKGKVRPGEPRWLVHCLDFQTGKLLWQAEAHRGKPATPLHLKNTYASETPVTDGRHVWAYFGNAP
jgi:outer membrane protein assembly factor BamB